MLIRIQKRKTSIEPQNLLDLYKVEFCRDGLPDLRLSVYEIESNQHIQVTSEHFAGLDLKPGARKNFDVTELWTLIDATPGSTGFSFADAHHREFVFNTANEHRQFVDRLIQALNTRTQPVTMEDIRSYVESMKTKGDPEWVAIMSQRSQSKDWVKIWRKVESPDSNIH